MLHPQLPCFLIAFKPKLDRNDILEALSEGGFLEATSKIPECNTR